MIDLKKEQNSNPLEVAIYDQLTKLKDMAVLMGEKANNGGNMHEFCAYHLAVQTFEQLTKDHAKGLNEYKLRDLQLDLHKQMSERQGNPTLDARLKNMYFDSVKDRSTFLTLNYLTRVEDAQG